MNLKSRRVLMMRCHIAPMIGPMSKNAYDFANDPLLKALGATAQVTEEGNGVIVLIKEKDKNNKEQPKLHFVGLPNIQNAWLELSEDEKASLKQDFSFDGLEKPQPKLKKVSSGAV